MSDPQLEPPRKRYVTVRILLACLLVLVLAADMYRFITDPHEGLVKWYLSVAILLVVGVMALTTPGLRAIRSIRRVLRLTRFGQRRKVARNNVNKVGYKKRREPDQS